MRIPTETKSPKLWTQKEIAALWKVHVRTVRRAIKDHNPKISAYLGLEPAMTSDEVEKLQCKILAHKAKVLAKLSQRMTDGKRRPSNGKA
jgi:hypothetical protein